MKKGLIILNTGNGKGKTTAAFGLALRAAGHGEKVCIIQFIKGHRETGEHKAFDLYKESIDFYTLGRGFTWKSNDIEQDIKAAGRAWDFAVETINSNNHFMVILDELTYLIKYGIISESLVLNTLVNKPFEMHVIITGRDATAALIGAADLATEMREIAHPYKSGVKAQAGIEF